MSKYTIELRKICDIYGRNEVENWFMDYDLSDYLTQSQIDVISETNTWSKDKLAKKIVDHYFMREIGQETPALFKHFAKVTIQEIMERMLPIIYTNCIEYDPFESVDFHITESRTINGNGTGSTQGTSNSSSNSNSNGSSLNVNSDTPQQNINKQNILNGSYATSTSANENTNTNQITDQTTNSSSSSSSSTTTETFRHDEKGNKGVMDSYQQMILQLRKTFRAIDEEIIKELNPLFFGLY